MSKSFEYLVLGGGVGGGYACKEFVALGVPAGSVGLIMAEPVVPYERPALTKAYLHPPGAKVRARLPGFHTCVGTGGERQTPEWYEDKGIELIKGLATNVDIKEKIVSVGDVNYTYKKLILATGSSPNHVDKFGIKGDNLSNVFYIRVEKDLAELVKALEALDGKGSVVIMGGGYIGMEVAAGVVGWGVQTTMVFPEGIVLDRYDPRLGKWLQDQFVARGIKLMKGETVAEFVGEGCLTGVTLKSGETLNCQIAIIGIGASPNVGICSGLKMASGGFAVDANLQTSDPDVYAIGDICAFPSMYNGELYRVEHVDHARKSAAQAVKAAMGLNPEPYKYMPYYYSRILEYSDAPIIFYFFGDSSGECTICPRGENLLGAIWVSGGKVVGALLIGSPGPSQEDQGKLRELVAAGPEDVGAVQVFQNANL